MTLPHQLSPRARAHPITPDGISRFSRAQELDRSDRTLAVAFVLSIGVHVALIALYVGFNSFASVGIATPGGGHGPGKGITWSVIGGAGAARSQERPAEVSMDCHGIRKGERIGSRAGVPVAVADPRIDSTPETHPAFALDGGGFSVGVDMHGPATDTSTLGQLLDPPLDDIHHDHSDHDPIEFRPVEEEFFDGVEPRVDLAELARNMVYPDLARRLGVQGMVVIKALIDERGRASVAKVEVSDNRLLDQAALDAVRNTRFTPGSRNGTAVPVWMAIPVKFQLQ